MSWLDLREEAGGPRYYVDGVPLHAGDQLEVHINGKWVSGRYEYNWPGRGHAIVPLFYFGAPEMVHRLDPEHDRVRLPESRW